MAGEGLSEGRERRQGRKEGVINEVPKRTPEKEEEERASFFFAAITMRRKMRGDRSAEEEEGVGVEKISAQE